MSGAGPRYRYSSSTAPQSPCFAVTSLSKKSWYATVYLAKQGQDVIFHLVYNLASIYNVLFPGKEVPPVGSVNHTTTGETTGNRHQLGNFMFVQAL